MAPPKRPQAVKEESKASGPLHHLQSELLSAKAAWEQLGVRIAKGYTTAYGKHQKTLTRMKKAKEEASSDALSFVFSIVSIGFAGGIVGGLMGPWIKRASESTAKFVFREGTRGLAQQGAKDLVKVGGEKLKDLSEASDDPYTTNSPKEIAVDVDIRDRISTAFGPVLEALDAMIAEANSRNADLATGQAILNNFRKFCPLMTDKPAQEDIPTELAASNASELSMWIAWANERDWAYWKPIYSNLDAAARKAAKIAADGGGMGTWDVSALREALELDPIGERLQALGKWLEVKNVTDKFVDPEPYKATEVAYMDLRKLKELRLEPTLPFRRIARLDLQWDKTKPLDRMKFLSNFQSLKPVYK